MVVGVFDVDLHACAGGRDEVEGTVDDDVVAEISDLLVYVVDVGTEGGGVFGFVGLEGRFHGAEE